MLGGARPTAGSVSGYGGQYSGSGRKLRWSCWWGCLPLKSYKPFTLTKNCYHWRPCLRCFPGDRFDVPGFYAIETNLPIRDRVFFDAGGLRNDSSKCEQESGSAEKRGTSPDSKSPDFSFVQQQTRQAEN